MLRSLIVKTSFFYLSHNDHSCSKTLPFSKTLSLSRNADEHFRSCDDGCFHWVHSRADDGSDLFTCKWRSWDAFLSNLFHLSSKWDFKADFQNNLRQRCYLHPKLVDGVDSRLLNFRDELTFHSLEMKSWKRCWSPLRQDLLKESCWVFFFKISKSHPNSSPFIKAE